MIKINFYNYFYISNNKCEIIPIHRERRLTSYTKASTKHTKKHGNSYLTIKLYRR